jgi:hypothetical protein
MYVEETDHAKVFSEAHRVLAPGGHLLIWDAITPGKQAEKEVGSVPDYG